MCSTYRLYLPVDSPARITYGIYLPGPEFHLDRSESGIENEFINSVKRASYDCLRLCLPVCVNLLHIEIKEAQLPCTQLVQLVPTVTILNR